MKPTYADFEALAPRQDHRAESYRNTPRPPWCLRIDVSMQTKSRQRAGKIAQSGIILVALFLPELRTAFEFSNVRICLRDIYNASSFLERHKSLREAGDETLRLFRLRPSVKKLGASCSRIRSVDMSKVD